MLTPPTDCASVSWPVAAVKAARPEAGRVDRALQHLRPVHGDRQHAVVDRHPHRVRAEQAGHVRRAVEQLGADVPDAGLVPMATLEATLPPVNVARIT